MAKIKNLFFYPIKSFRGVSTSELYIDDQGPRFDRQWLLVDAANRFITQRTHPSLARIELRMDGDIAIELSRPELGTVDFGLEEREGDEFEVKIWKDTVPAFEVSAEVSNWLSEFIGDKVKLVRLSANARRTFSERFPSKTVRFVDSKPALVISTASLKNLESIAKVTLSMARFRPNIVVDEVLPHGEDQWGGFKVGPLEFQTLAPCSRCKVTTVHPLTGEMGEEPLKTLSTYRRQEGGIMFGQYFANINTGRVKVGDTISIV